VLQLPKSACQISKFCCNNLEMNSAMGIQMENGTTKQVTVEEQNAEIAVCSRWAV
jgi:hypothetical protein